MNCEQALELVRSAGFFVGAYVDERLNASTKNTTHRFSVHAENVQTGNYFLLFAPATNLEQVQMIVKNRRNQPLNIPEAPFNGKNEAMLDDEQLREFVARFASVGATVV